MDRKALSKRLEGLSSVFASETPIATDLKAMAYTLGKMSDDKFKTILSSEFSVDASDAKEECDDKEVAVDAAKVCDKGCDCDKDDKSKEASEEGLYWNREASDLVIANLVKEVTGAILTKVQTPDGDKKATKPSTLKEEQTPAIKDVLDSDMVKKSHGAVKKEAGAKEGPGVPDGTGPMKDTPECKTKTEVEAAAGDIDPENMAKPTKENGSLEDMAKSENKDASISEGVELNAPMIEASLDSKDIEDLGRLFA